MVVEMRQKQTFVVEYHQKVYHYSDGRKRITPIFIQTVDTDNYKRKRTKFSDQTMNKVLPEVIDITEPYEWTPHENKPKVEVKCESKPMVKCETKDVILFPKIECKNEVKYEVKPVLKSELKSEAIKSEVLPSKSYSWDSFEFKSLQKRLKIGDDNNEEKTGSVYDSDFEISDDEVIDEVRDVYSDDEVVDEVRDKQTEPKKSSEASTCSQSKLSIASDISSTSDPFLKTCDSETDIVSQTVNQLSDGLTTETNSVSKEITTQSCVQMPSVPYSSEELIRREARNSIGSDISMASNQMAATSGGSSTEISSETEKYYNNSTATEIEESVATNTLSAEDLPQITSVFSLNAVQPSMANLPSTSTANKSLIRCDLCPKMFNSTDTSDDYRRHYNNHFIIKTTHSKTRKYVHRLCGRVFDTLIERNVDQIGCHLLGRHSERVAPKTSTPLTLKEAINKTKKRPKEKSKNTSKQKSNELSVSPEKKKRTKKVKSIPLVNILDESSEDEPNLLLTSYSSTETEVNDTPTVSQSRPTSESLVPSLPSHIMGLIFSKMSIKEKLRCECVCKEWQKIIVSQQKTLNIEFKCVFKAKWYEVFCVGDALQFNWETTFNNISEKLISKFTNLEEISIVCHKKVILNPIINHINDKLVKLTSVRFYGQISTDVLTRFWLLFGDKLQSLDINSGDFKLTSELLNDSKLFKKLRTVYVNKSVECLRGCHLPQLREVLDINMKDLKALPFLADLYAKQLTKIKFREPNNKNPLYLKYGEISHTLNQLMRFQSLEYMELYFADYVLDSEFVPIEQNCKNLKELHIFGRNAYFNINRVNSFKELKVLGLFIECQKRYKLDFRSLLALQLTELWMYCDITSEQMIEILTQMKSLKTLHIISNYCWESGIVQILNCDSNLETIYLEDSLLNDRSKGVADAFVNKAKRNPKVHYRMFSEAYKRDNPLEKSHRVKRKDLPQNVEFILHENTPDPFRYVVFN